MTLKYLFRAEYRDGSVIEQTHEDRSAIDPEKRNCFYDVLNGERPLSELKTFSIHGEGHSYLVDLTDGHFEVDGVAFFMHEACDKSVDPMQVTENVNLRDFRLVYYIANAKTFSADVQDGKIIGMKESGHIRTWHLGWQCTVDGENYQKIMRVK